MEISREKVLEVLGSILEPDLKKDLVSANLVEELAIEGSKITLKVFVSNPALHARKRMQEALDFNLKRDIGFFTEQNNAVVWRGPMASKALTQMFTDAHWGKLDYLLIDLPPGTGDIHLSLVQTVPLDGAVIVSTPQEVALADARKGVNMFQLDSINVPVVGIIENMAWFTPEELPENKYYIFGRDGAKNLAHGMNVPFLGHIPLVQGVREAGDIGRPAVFQENSPTAKAFDEIVSTFVERVTSLKDKKQAHVH